jgi:hypothetical protein
MVEHQEYTMAWEDYCGQNLQSGTYVLCDSRGRLSLQKLCGTQPLPSGKAIRFYKVPELPEMRPKNCRFCGTAPRVGELSEDNVFFVACNDLRCGVWGPLRSGRTAAIEAWDLMHTVSKVEPEDSMVTHEWVLPPCEGCGSGPALMMDLLGDYFVKCRKCGDTTSTCGTSYGAIRAWEDLQDESYSAKQPPSAPDATPEPESPEKRGVMCPCGDNRVSLMQNLADLWYVQCTNSGCRAYGGAYDTPEEALAAWQQ